MEVSCTRHTVNLNTTTDKYLGIHTGISFHFKYWRPDPLYDSSLNAWPSASSAQRLVSFFSKQNGS